MRPARRGSGLAGLALLAVLVLAAAAAAQETSSTAQEFWPEIDTWLRLSPAWRLSVFVPISKNVETNYREGSFIPQVDFAWGKFEKLPIKRWLVNADGAAHMRRFMVRAGYLTGTSLGDQGENYRENQVFFEFHLRTPFKGKILVSNRLRTDFRWLGSDNAFSARVRYRLMVEKEFTSGKTSIVPYVNGEAYYDSRYDTVNRIRLIGGATVAWWKWAALEGNITYQHDSRMSTTNLWALNIILHLFFETKS